LRCFVLQDLKLLVQFKGMFPLDGRRAAAKRELHGFIVCWGST